MIPKIVFTYWEGDQLSELHYLTIYSLHKYNPDLDIIIYTDKKPSNILREWKKNEHENDIQTTISISKLIQVNPNKIYLIPINFQSEYNFNNNLSIVFKADFIRIAKLYEHGGIWFDMDILFVKPIPEFFFQQEIDTFIFMYDGLIPTGFLASIPKSQYLEILFNRSLKIIKNKELNNYKKISQIIWIEEYNKLIKIDKIKILDNNLVYPFLLNELDNLFKNNNIKIQENTFGIYWYNGAIKTKNFINKFNLKKIIPNNSLIEKLVYKMNQDEEEIKIDNDNENSLDQNKAKEIITCIEIKIDNENNVNQIQDEYYNKILNINNNITVIFIIPEIFLKKKNIVLTFYKCWRNRYCLNNSNIKIPNNIKKVILKKM